MVFDFDKLFSVHQQALKLRSARAQLIASNLANTDTPNYKAKDIDFRSVLKSEQNDASRLRTTHAAHFNTAGATNSSTDFEVKYRIPLQPSLDGNTVDGHVEKAEFSRNALHYQVTLQFLGRRAKGMLGALKGE